MLVPSSEQGYVICRFRWVDPLNNTSASTEYNYLLNNIMLVLNILYLYLFLEKGSVDNELF
jgi:hypothetical protein